MSYTREEAKKVAGEIMKKMVCLLIEKYSSIENERTNPVNPKDKIKTKFILSIDNHQFRRYFIIY